MHLFTFYAGCFVAVFMYIVSGLLSTCFWVLFLRYPVSRFYPFLKHCEGVSVGSLTRVVGAPLLCGPMPNLSTLLPPLLDDDPLEEQVAPT